MEPLVAVALVVLALVAVAVAYTAIRNRRREHLKDRFGPEYDRTLDRSATTRAAERELKEREQFHDELDLRELSAAERDRYRELWDSVQSSFVDHPDEAVRDADDLVASVMRDRGYPVDDFEQQADLVSVDHPEVVSHYRRAHDIAERNHSQQTSTEERREAFVHYRALFDDLLDTNGKTDDNRRHHV